MRRLLAVALLALALPAAASAHATLTKTEPQFGTRVERSPKLVRLHFDQSVERCRTPSTSTTRTAGSSRARRG